MKILLVGDAGREHAIAEAIAQSYHAPRLYAFMKLRNPGIIALCKKTGGDFLLGDYLDPNAVVRAASRLRADLVVVGPEEPLFRGVADALEGSGFPCVGARRACAGIEMSKAFMRRLMWKHQIPGRLRFKSFISLDDAISYLHEYAESVALKPARQAGGKGVKVIADLQAYLSSEKVQVKREHAKAIHEKFMGDYSDIEDRILIEERVEGAEYTLQAFTDGRTVMPLPMVQDNKNAFEMDIGPETGGMGSIADSKRTLPFITEQEYRQSVELIRKCVKALAAEVGLKYKGIISGQMMLTANWGPTIIEFYSRLGDPEAVNVIPMLKTDFVDICWAIINEKLNKLKLKVEAKATVVKCVAPQGYPDHREIAKGHPLEIDIRAIEKKGCRVYFASTDLREDGTIVSGGSRVAEILASDASIPKASEKAEACIPYVKFKDGWVAFHRSDIGSPVLLTRRMEQAKLARGVYKYKLKRGLRGKSIEWIPKKGKIILAS